MDLQIREAVEIYGSTKYISTENLLSAVLDSKKIGKILGKYEDIGKIINRSKEELKLLKLTKVDCKCKLNKIYQATISVEYTLSRKVSNSSSGL